MKLLPALSILCAFSVAYAVEYSLPTANQGDWAPSTSVGVIGGIDQFRVGGASARTTLINVTQAPYNADNTGATDATAAIQAAVDAATDGEVVYLPAGTYKILSWVIIEPNDSNITIRGDGASTIIYGSNGGLPIFGFTGGGYASQDQVQTITGTKTKGTTALQITDASVYPVGTICTVFVENEEDNTRILNGAAPTWSSAGFRDIRWVLSRVTASDSGTDIVTVHPPLPWDCSAYATRIEKGVNDYRNYRIGFEDFAFTFDAASHPTDGIKMDHAVECWMYNISAPEWKKNTSSGDIVKFDYSHRCEVRKCDFRTLAPSSYSDDGAIQLYGSSCLLIEDNISVGFDSGLYNSGNTINCLISYNYFSGAMGAYPGHNGHNSLDLYEGNILAPFFQLDGYHGSNSHMNFYRNWITVGPIANRFMYYIALVGNVYGHDGTTDAYQSFGNPNIGNSSYTGTANHFTGDPHADWGMTGTLTTRTSDTTGTVTVVGGDWDASTGGTDRLPSFIWSGGSRHQMTMDSRTGQVLTVSGGQGTVLPAQGTSFTKVFAYAQGYQELDGGVASTAIRVENYVGSAIAPGALEYPTADTLPNSLAYASKPSWFYGLAWPAVNPDSPTFSIEIIPAGYRYENAGADPPAEGGGTITTLNITTLTVGP